MTRPISPTGLAHGTGHETNQMTVARKPPDASLLQAPHGIKTPSRPLALPPGLGTKTYQFWFSHYNHI